MHANTMIELLREIADSVGRALSSSERKYWKEPAGMGADGTLTNKIDLISENSVREVLKRHGNPVNILSEEAGFIDFGREKTLVLDPIDGTYNALNGIPFY
jgi:fructose-1,6-bisphosphatase/inositol monophosphatase family enzyme